MKIIKLHVLDEIKDIALAETLSTNYKGKMSRQSQEEIEKQLHGLRSE